VGGWEKFQKQKKKKKKLGGGPGQNKVSKTKKTGKRAGIK
jgi:hypothetical protein